MAGPGAAAAAAAAARMAADMAKQAQESAAMRGAGPSVAASTADTYDPSYCSVKLPHPKPLAPIESEVSHIQPQCAPLYAQPKGIVLDLCYTWDRVIDRPEY